MNLVDDFGMRTMKIHYGGTILAFILFFEGWGRGRHTLEAHGRIEPTKKKPLSVAILAQASHSSHLAK